MKKRRAEQTYSTIPGISGGQNVPNTSTFGATRGDTTVWQPPGPTRGVAPQPTTPAPMTPAPASNPAMPYGAMTYGMPGMPQVNTTAPAIPLARVPRQTANEPAAWNGNMEYIGPGQNWQYNQGEYNNTLMTYATGLPWNENARGPQDLRAGWYGMDTSGGTPSYSYSGSLTGIQEGGADTAVYYDPNYGNPDTYNSVSSGRRGRRNYRYRSYDTKRPGKDRKLNMGGKPPLQGEGWTRAGRPTTSAPQQPTASTTPSWMGQMVGFSP